MSGSATERRQGAAVIPIDNPFVTVEASGDTHPGIPQLARGVLLVPVLNVGDEEATQVSAALSDADRKRTSRVNRPVTPGEARALIFGSASAIPKFALELDVCDRQGSWSHARYEWLGADKGYIQTSGEAGRRIGWDDLIAAMDALEGRSVAVRVLDTSRNHPLLAVMEGSLGSRFTIKPHSTHWPVESMPSRPHAAERPGIHLHRDDVQHVEAKPSGVLVIHSRAIVLNIRPLG